MDKRQFKTKDGLKQVDLKKKSDTNETQDNSKGELLLSSYITPKFYSQKGGDKQDLAGRYANQFIFHLN